MISSSARARWNSPLSMVPSVPMIPALRIPAALRQSTVSRMASRMGMPISLSSLFWK